ncbi:hypothetical protein NPIL_523541 [Nephila pilipes]|uniref:Uncharacterized protein n=1 Tax=Nephila pilipes TaxID=299642 RepID=A0A8X6PLM4_NEPPI|nr:hypothetical protein NPIL_523541 [Nephila pilipes]
MLAVGKWNNSLKLLESRQNHHTREVSPRNRQNAPKNATFMPSIDQSKRTNSSPWQSHSSFCTRLTTFSKHFDNCLQKRSNNQAATQNIFEEFIVLELQNSMLLIPTAWNCCFVLAKIQILLVLILINKI